MIVIDDMAVIGYRLLEYVCTDLCCASCKTFESGICNALGSDMWEL
jgi:hypothetical protein